MWLGVYCRWTLPLDLLPHKYYNCQLWCLNCLPARTHNNCCTTNINKNSWRRVATTKNYSTLFASLAKWTLSKALCLNPTTRASHSPPPKPPSNSKTTSKYFPKTIFLTTTIKKTPTLTTLSIMKTHSKTLPKSLFLKKGT